ncbi:uncharacterized protein EV420DRAFT_1304397 [Desarmillaria tabescens]|uniref:Peptidase C14 caspase domain-containing protein n=1 Tax=Armillaria tabescens TaxID=1929756 RepID=A0AA39NAY7_ARMTA|nr:uncharacterized protein EV420DRAFT_1304397 [Desarmillaria tabescens]KAK0462295.1 hypothetical protein EV420DRAFT_1304397 [Desarmillaria tabescens]
MAEDSGIFNQVKSTKRPTYINFPNIQNLCHECLKFFHYNNRSQFSVATSAPHKVDASRFWAVVIGIDEYKEISILECGVADAQSFQQYLIADLGVPEGRIQLLLGSKEHDSPTDPMCPSRTCIIDALLSLIDNHEIEKGDNIIFYYAGHGSSYKCSDYRDDEMPDAKISPGNIGYIEALCPIDRDTHDANGEAVPDISDRELNTILKLISRAKGPPHHRHSRLLLFWWCWPGCSSTGGPYVPRNEMGYYSRYAPRRRGESEEIWLPVHFVAGLGDGLRLPRCFGCVQAIPVCEREVGGWSAGGGFHALALARSTVWLLQCRDDI